jgi:hypothetical protein
MILPTKYLSPERSLIGIGAEILAQLDTDRTVSELWARVQNCRSSTASPLSFDWFVLSLTFLFSIAAVDYERGIVFRSSSR